MNRTIFHRDGKNDVSSIDLITDGKHEATRNYRGYQSHIRMYWEDNVLVLDERATARDGSAGSNVVRYSLSPDGKTLTATEHDEIPNASWTNQWVFDRHD